MGSIGSVSAARGLRRLRMRREWLVASAALVATAGLLVVGCASSPDPVDAGGSTASSLPPQGSDASADPETTAALRTTTSVPYTEAAVQAPYRAVASTADCGLVPVREDFADLPQTDEPTTRFPQQVLPPPEATPVAVPTWVQPVSALGDWFIVGGVGLAHFDPATAAADRVFARTGTCRIRAAATSAARAAIIGCPGQDSFTASVAPCTLVVVALDDGSTIGSWQLTDLQAQLSLSDGSVVMLGTEVGDRVGVARFDPVTGSGTVVAVDGCRGDRTAQLRDVVELTSLVIGTCDDDSIVVDATNGDLLFVGELPDGQREVTSDGTEVWAVGYPRRDAIDFTQVAPPRVSGATIEELGIDVSGGLHDGTSPGSSTAIETTGAIWVRRCAERCDIGEHGVEILRFDTTTGQVTDSWTTTGVLLDRGRGGTAELTADVASADPEGVWLVTDGQLSRLARHR